MIGRLHKISYTLKYSARTCLQILSKALARDKQESKVARRKHKLQQAQQELHEAEKARDALKSGT